MKPSLIALLAGLFGRSSSAAPDAPKALKATATGLAAVMALSRPTPTGAMDLGLRHLNQSQKRRNRRRAWAAGDRAAFRRQG